VPRELGERKRAVTGLGRKFRKPPAEYRRDSSAGRRQIKSKKPVGEIGRPCRTPARTRGSDGPKQQETIIAWSETVSEASLKKTWGGGKNLLPQAGRLDPRASHLSWPLIEKGKTKAGVGSSQAEGMRRSDCDGKVCRLEEGVRIQDAKTLVGNSDSGAYLRKNTALLEGGGDPLRTCRTSKRQRVAPRLPGGGGDARGGEVGTPKRGWRSVRIIRSGGGNARLLARKRVSRGCWGD